MDEQARGEVERLLREANVFRLRRQLDQAEARCQAALAVSPGDADAREMLGDLLRERDQLEQAAEQYRLARSTAPERASSEKKLAEVTLELAERQRLRDLAQLALDQPLAVRQKKSRRNATVAVLAALVWPGLGQFVVAEGVTVKGIVLAALSLLCFPGLLALFQMMLVFMGFGRTPGADGSALLGLCFFLLWIYGIGDVLVQAQRSAGESSERLGF